MNVDLYLVTPPNSKLNIALVEAFQYYVDILQGGVGWGSMRVITNDSPSLPQ